ncbi:hypothetical protein V5O48_003015 [Marasmius crinis-equi]|uniref:Uncharacterized protein n=1 Tax=Marasmius crinis-equi TaxID=585013 RepID=A0ABR3FUI0_9AGAR
MFMRGGVVLSSVHLRKNVVKSGIVNALVADLLSIAASRVVPAIGKRIIAVGVRRSLPIKKTDGFSPIMRNDIRFFAYLLEDHLRHFADEISQQIKPSLDSFNGYEYETVEFPPGNRHPILFIAFDTPALPQAADARVLSQSDVNEWRRTGYFCGSWWLSSVFHRWKDTESTEILVVASFPRAQGVGWPYVTVVNFPLEKDLRFISDI